MTDTTTRSTSTPSTAQQAKDEAAGVAAAAKDEAANVATSAKQEASAVAQTAVDEAKNLTAEATQQARQVFDDARQQLQAKANEEAQRLAGAVADLGTQLRTMADAGQAGLARDLVAQVADGSQRIAQHLRQGGLDRTMADARRLARNRPGTFLLGAAAAGFVAARVARSADTAALKDAAMSDAGNGQTGASSQRGGDLQWRDPDLLLEATQPRPTPQSTGTAAPAHHADRPLVADPIKPQGAQ
jgi:hypothetical protein